MTAGAAALQWDSFTDKSQGKWRLPLLAPIFAINFGTTQCCTLLAGYTSIGIAGICHLALSLAVWALVKLKASARGTAIGIAAAAGIASSYTWGTVLPLWSTIFFCAVASGYRRVRDFVVLALAAAISVVPYVLCLRKVTEDIHVHQATVSVPSLQIVVNLLGRPLCDAIGLVNGPLMQSQTAGSIGLALT
ncbi:MAG: hypothetical protein ACRD3W_27105, partial [Terriglobales bacterium]